MSSPGGGAEAPGAEAAGDAELLQAHVDGDADAFGILFARHRDRLWAVALRTMGNPEDAADGLQDGLIAAYPRAASFRGEAAVTTWLHRVVVNACLDRLRAAKVRSTDPLPDDLDDHDTHRSLASATDAADDPAEIAVLSDRRRAVLAALATLPVEQRAALVLVDMEGYSVAEAAEILDCATGTVKSRCSRGRTRLAGLLGLLAPADRRDPGHRNPHPSSSVPSTAAPRGPPAGGSQSGPPNNA